MCQGDAPSSALCPPQRQLQVPLLWATHQGQLPAAAAPGGPAAHGHAGPALCAEAEVGGGPPPRGARLALWLAQPRHHRVLCSRLKPIQKLEGMTNGVAVGPQQASGLSDISAQVQQYQQFLGECPPHRAAPWSPFLLGWPWLWGSQQLCTLRLPYPCRNEARVPNTAPTAYGDPPGSLLGGHRLDLPRPVPCCSPSPLLENPQPQGPT